MSGAAPIVLTARRDPLAGLRSAEPLGDGLLAIEGGMVVTKAVLTLYQILLAPSTTWRFDCGQALTST